MRASTKIAPRRHENSPARATKIRGRLPRLMAFALGAATLFTVSGCTQDEGGTVNELERRETGLLAFDTCEDLLGYFQAEATADLELGYGYGYAYGVPRGIGAPEPALDVQAGAPTSGEAGGASDNAAGPGFSTTNVQERGVDEPDLVKTDGQFIYAVRNGHLVVVEASNLTTRSEVTLAFEGSQLLLSDNLVVVLGSAYQAPTVPGVEVPAERQFLSRAVAALYDVADRAQPRLLRTLYIDGGLVAARLTGRTARLVVHHDPSISLGDVGVPGGGTPDLPPVAIEGGTASSGPGDAGAAEPTEAAEPAPAPEPMADEITAEADAGAGVDPYQAWLEAAKARIAETTLETWLPHVIDVDAVGQGTTRLAADCARFFRPGERAGLGTTVVVSLDLDQPAASLPDPALVASTSTVYASGENLYLATVNWRDFIGPAMAVDVAAPGVSQGGGTSSGGSTGSAGATSPGAPAETDPYIPPMEAAEQGQAAAGDVDDASAPDDREATQIHRLSLPAGSAAVYQASGRVHGQLLNQFSLSEFEGHLRVAATEHAQTWFGGGDVSVEAPTTGTADAPEARPVDSAAQPQVAEAPRSVTRVTVLDGALATVGQTEDVAPNEDIFAVRFIDDRGFVVTFERKDPLFTVDLSTPTAPRIVGELEVLGYSTYLHPIDDSHLLGVGRSADENGFETGMQLSLFDVSDLSAPTLDAQLLLGEGWSDAAYDHHALTFFDGLLMLPLQAWSEAAALDGIEVFDVDVSEGIVRRGTIDHSALAAETGYAHVERSLVIDDVIYTVSNAGLVASHRGDLTEIGHVLFPQSVGGGNDPGVEVQPRGEEEQAVPPADDRGV